MVRIGSVEVRDKTGIHDKVSWDPGALLQAVPLSVHQILDPTSTAAGAEETPDSEHRTSVNELRERRGRNGRSQRAFLDRFDPGDMIGWVDPHGTRKLKAYRRRVYDADYGEWSYEPGGQLATLHFER